MSAFIYRRIQQTLFQPNLVNKLHSLFEWYRRTFSSRSLGPLERWLFAYDEHRAHISICHPHSCAINDAPTWSSDISGIQSYIRITLNDVLIPYNEHCVFRWTLCISFGEIVDKCFLAVCRWKSFIERSPLAIHRPAQWIHELFLF